MTYGFPIVQMAWIVDDLETAMQKWLRTTKIGPFYVFSHAKIENCIYRGQPAILESSAALAQAGPVQIELIQQHSDGPSAYRDIVAAGQTGFHHVATFCPDFDAAVADYLAKGKVLATEGSFGDMRFAYVDSRDDSGSMIELIEAKESIQSVFATVAKAAENWNGQDPIRLL